MPLPPLALTPLALAAAQPNQPSLSALALIPDSYTTPAGAPLGLTLETNTGEAADWPGVRWMLIRVASTQRNLDTPALDLRGRATATLDSAGTGIVGVDFEPTIHETTLADLRAFIADRGRVQDPALLEGEGPFAIRRVQSVKTIIRAGDAAGEAGASEATGKSGQQVEFRPLMDPAATTVNGDIAIRAYIAGSGVQGARIIATHTPTRKRSEITGDSHGIGNLTITDAGPWLIEMHELRRGKGDSPWTLYSATLTFEVPTPEAAR